MTPILNQILTVPPVVAYVIIVALVLGEAALFVGFVLPGETAVLLGGALASTGRLSLPLLLVLVVVAAVVGDSIGFEVGRHFGPRILRLAPLQRHEERIERARASIKRRGGMAVVIGRTTAFLRAVMPALAGLSRMSYPRFLAFNILGAVLWGVSVTLLGYFAGSSLKQIERNLGRGSAIVVVAVVLVAAFVWHRRRRAREG